MSARESKSLRFNQISWRVSRLGEAAWLLQSKGISLQQVHSSVHLAKKLLAPDLVDIVPSYDSIALFHRGDEKDILLKLQARNVHNEGLEGSEVNSEVPICYELGLDLEVVASHNGLNVEEVISCHLRGSYTAALIGFTPGFIYMSGLDTSLSCPRRPNPRKYLEAGSVGIGGNQTGIYSLNSPGGWNIIGRTPLPLFDIEKQPPLSIEIGSKISFKRITKMEFEKWAS